MKRFSSAVRVGSPDFQKNYEAYCGLLNRTRMCIERWKSQGRDKRVRREREKGKLTGRERLALLLDPDSPFLEIGALNGFPNFQDGSSMVGGVGVVNGVECMVVCNIFTVGSGSMNLRTAKKWDRCADIAMRQQLPFVQLLESSGADLSKAFQVFHGKPNKFATMARRSAAHLPTVTLVMGTCIAGGAYSGGMSDYIVMIDKQSSLALAGTKLVFQATGEKSSEEELGGAWMHASVSGVSDYCVRDEFAALATARRVLAEWGATRKKTMRFRRSCVDPLWSYGRLEEPRYNPEELLGIVSVDPLRKPYDVRELVARVVDGSRFVPFKPSYGESLVCLWTRIYGIPVGILANNGVIFHESAQKGAHFVNLCNQRGVPLLFLHNVTGFMVGKRYERAGIIKWGSQLVSAISTATVPKISLLVGGSFGAANYAMCGWGFDPDFIFAYPSACSAVMGPDQLAGVMSELARNRFKRGGKSVDEKKVQLLHNKYSSRIRRQMEAVYMSGNGIDDGVIDPRDTRQVLGLCLSLACNATWHKESLRGICRL